MKATTLLAETLMAALLAVPMFARVPPADEKVPCRNYKDVLALFDRLGYKEKAWQAGIREIPRVYLADVPDTWRERSAKDLSNADKKGLFFRLIAPIALRVNELILEDRVRVKELTERLAQGQSVTPDDQAWLTELAVKYKVLESKSERLGRLSLQPLACFSFCGVVSREVWWATSKRTGCAGLPAYVRT
jgi:hypothetical protein